MQHGAVVTQQHSAMPGSNAASKDIGEFKAMQLVAHLHELDVVRAQHGRGEEDVLVPHEGLAALAQLREHGAGHGIKLCPLTWGDAVPNLQHRGGLDLVNVQAAHGSSNRGCAAAIGQFLERLGVG